MRIEFDESLKLAHHHRVILGRESHSFSSSGAEGTSLIGGASDVQHIAEGIELLQEHVRGKPGVVNLDRQPRFEIDFANELTDDEWAKHLTANGFPDVPWMSLVTGE